VCASVTFDSSLGGAAQIILLHWKARGQVEREVVVGRGVCPHQHSRLRCVCTLHPPACAPTSILTLHVRHALNKPGAPLSKAIVQGLESARFFSRKDARAAAPGQLGSFKPSPLPPQPSQPHTHAHTMRCTLASLVVLALAAAPALVS
jgi:hypothetical protein